MNLGLAAIGNHGKSQLTQQRRAQQARQAHQQEQGKHKMQNIENELQTEMGMKKLRQSRVVTLQQRLNSEAYSINKNQSLKNNGSGMLNGINNNDKQGQTIATGV